MSLAEQYGFKEITPHIILEVSPFSWKQIEDSLDNSPIISNYSYFDYQEVVDGPLDKDHIRVRIYMLQFTPKGKSMLTRDKSSYIRLSTRNSQMSNTIIDLTGKYPKYLKDRQNYHNRPINDKGFLTVFQADLNKWFKYSIS